MAAADLPVSALSRSGLNVNATAFQPASAPAQTLQQEDALPEAAKYQIVLFVGFLEFFSESGAAGAHYTKGGKPGAFPSFNSPEAGDQFKIPHPVPLDLWHKPVQKLNCPRHRRDTDRTRLTFDLRTGTRSASRRTPPPRRRSAAASSRSTTAASR